MLYPIDDRMELFNNEISILNKLNEKFQNRSVENGIVRISDSGVAEWKHEDDMVGLPDKCIAIVYTHGMPLFPVLRRCVQNNDQKMLFWFFSRMVSATTNDLIFK